MDKPEYIIVKKNKVGQMRSMDFETHVRLLEYAIHSANEEELRQAVNMIEINTLKDIKALIEERIEKEGLIKETNNPNIDHS